MMEDLRREKCRFYNTRNYISIEDISNIKLFVVFHVTVLPLCRSLKTDLYAVKKHFVSVLKPIRVQVSRKTFNTSIC